MDALFGSVVLIFYLAQREREAAVGDAAVELDQLRRAMAGANIFYRSTDTLSSTLSYSHVLEAMLQAGTNGMPPTRQEDPPPVGMVMLFDDSDADKYLKVVAWRHLDRADIQRRIPGRTGLVAETLERGDAATMPNVAS